jgi:hypothetical protein
MPLLVSNLSKKGHYLRLQSLKTIPLTRSCRFHRQCSGCFRTSRWWPGRPPTVHWHRLWSLVRLVRIGRSVTTRHTPNRSLVECTGCWALRHVAPARIVRCRQHHLGLVECRSWAVERRWRHPRKDTAETAKRKKNEALELLS